MFPFSVYIYSQFVSIYESINTSPSLVLILHTLDFTLFVLTPLVFPVVTKFALDPANLLSPGLIPVIDPLVYISKL